MIPAHNSNEMMIKRVIVAFVAIFIATVSFTFVMVAYDSIASVIR